MEHLVNRKYFYKLSLLMLLVLALVSGLAVLSPSRAHAIYGVANDRGYFDNKATLGGRVSVFPEGIAPNTDTAAEFIAEIKGHLGEDDQHVTGAQFIIHTMLGRDGPRPRPVSAADLADWEARINSLANGITGSIQWKAIRTISCSGEQNTAYDPGLNDVTPSTSVTPHGCGPGVTSVNNEVIKFFDKGGNLIYEIKRNCGNPLGDMAGLPEGQVHFDGVKIDDSGLKAGGSNTDFGGNCAPTDPPNDGRCRGSMGSYPFSDDTVYVDGVPLPNNYFALDFSAGSHSVGVSQSGNGSWLVKGYSICDWSVIACDSFYLTNPSNFNGGGLTSFTYNFVAGHAYSMRWIYSTDPVSGTASLDGVKIDDSGYNVGGSNANFGGNCTRTNPPDDARCPDTNMANWPFSDDCVSVSGVGSDCNNYFRFNNSIPEGDHTISISPSGVGNGSWIVFGYKVCDFTAGSCDSYLLTSPPLTGNGNSFTHTFEGGHTYSMRWIYRTAPPVGCSPATQTVEVNSLATITATGGGGSGTYSWTGSPVSTTGTSATFSFPTAGSRTITVSSTVGSPKSCTIVVVTRPYLTVYGGDVVTGSSGFGSACSPSSTKILTFNKGSAGSFAGAGARMAVFALNTIDQFASGGGGASGKGFSFSNTTGDPTYGGNFGQTFCPPDFWKPTAPVGGTQTIPAMSVANGSNPVVYIQGDAYITGNIVYAGSGSWANVSEIPSFYLVVKGDIYIDKSVTQLDGVYVAMPNGASGGTIYTCTNGSTKYPTAGPVPVAAAPGGCGSQLVINGSFIAKQVKFLRTQGSVANASNSGPNPLDANIAEIFIYGPEIWAR